MQLETHNYQYRPTWQVSIGPKNMSSNAQQNLAGTEKEGHTRVHSDYTLIPVSRV